MIRVALPLILAGLLLACNVAAPATKPPLPTPTSQVPGEPTPPIDASRTPTLEEVTDWLVLVAGEKMAADEVQAALVEAGYLVEESDFVVAELSGDGQPEVIARLVDPTLKEIPPWGPPGIVLLVDAATVQEVYRLDIEEGASAELLLLEDLSGDGQPDLLFEETICGAHTCTQYFHLHSYHESDSPEARLLDPETERPVQMPEGEWKVEDRTGDGLPELILEAGPFGSVGAGPQRARQEIYRWDQGAMHLIETIYEASELRYFKLLDANLAFDAGKYDEVIVLYDEAAKSETLLPTGYAPDAEEKSAIKRFAGFRLVLSFLAIGDSETALHRLAWLQALAPEDLITEAAEILYRRVNEGSDLETACGAVTEYALTIPSITTPLDAMGYANPSLSPETLCPFTR